MTIAEVHEKATKFQRRVRVRNWIEYVAAVFVVVAFGSYVFTLPNLLGRVGAALVVAGVLVVVWQLHRRGSARAAPPASVGSLALHRAELVRQRDALESVPLWYLSPMTPGLLLMIIAKPLSGETTWSQAAIALAICTAVFGFVWWLNARGARVIQAAIDELDQRGAG